MKHAYLVLAILAVAGLEAEAFSLGLRGVLRPLRIFDKRARCENYPPTIRFQDLESNYPLKRRHGVAVTMSTAPRIPAWDTLTSLLPSNKRRKSSPEPEITFNRDFHGNTIAMEEDFGI